MCSMRRWTGGGESDSWFQSPYWDPFEAESPDLGAFNSKDNDVDPTTTELSHAPIDCLETPDAHIFRGHLPGVKKEDLKVQVEDGSILKISGGRFKEEHEDRDVEFQIGCFVRRFKLPDDANFDGIKCTLEQGVLIVTVPKE